MTNKINSVPSCCASKIAFDEPIEKIVEKKTASCCHSKENFESTKERTSSCCSKTHKETKLSILILALFLAFLAELGHWLNFDNLIILTFSTSAILLVGIDICKHGIKNLFSWKFDMQTLMALAVLGAYLIGSWAEASMVITLYMLGEYLEHKAIAKSKSAVRELLKLAPNLALVKQENGDFQTISTNKIKVDDIIKILPNENIPLDGKIIQGQSSINESVITGESLFIEKNIGDNVWAGSVNYQGELLVKIENKITQLERIVKAVEKAQAERNPTQRFVDKFASKYTPSVMLFATIFAISMPLFFNWSTYDSVYRALTLLVIACPCSLILSTSVSVVSSLSNAAKKGVLFKNTSALEDIKNLKNLALDKTGTLTTGIPTLINWQNLSNNFNDKEIINLTYFLSKNSNHPVSIAINNGLNNLIKIENEKDKKIDFENIELLNGQGIFGEFNNQKFYLIGFNWLLNNNLINSELKKIIDNQAGQGFSISFLTTQKEVLGYFAVADVLRKESKLFIQNLNDLNIKTFILSGDHPKVVENIAKQLNIKDFKGGLLPEDKLNYLKEIQNKKDNKNEKIKVGMIGDGINDAPALSQADLSFAISSGTNVATESAEIILKNNNLNIIPNIIKLSKKTNIILWENVSFSVISKFSFFVLALAGITTMWMAVLADVGVSLLVILNSLRLRSF